jgi:murein L,D-transpeptidase YcbB/YkuD
MSRWCSALLLILMFQAPAQAQEATAQAIETMLNAIPRSPLASYSLDLGALNRFYEMRNYAPAWQGSAAKSDAGMALHTLEAASAEGLNPSDYHTVALAARAASHAPDADMAYDIFLSASLLQYSKDVRRGRVAPDVVGDVALPADGFDAVTAMSNALAHGNFSEYLAQLPPPHAQYQALKLALQHYRTLEKSGGWRQIPGGSEIKFGEDDPRTDLLRARLTAEGYFPSSGSGDSASLLVAVRDFQEHSGLEVDGRVGRKTLTALNVPVSERIDQIIANMERWRWVPRHFDSVYIEVNTADASLRAVRDGKIVLSSRIIAGKPRSPTPIFTAEVTGVTVNPYWHVPVSIARNEILPQVRRNPDYLEKHHMYIDAAGMVHQNPGPDNSLGLVKLEMPNVFNTYLHDTPARNLFASNERFLSHGCMRVEQIQALASFVLTGDPTEGLPQLQAAIDAGANQLLSLDKPIPVYVFYWTAMAGATGETDFRSDVYGRDRLLLAALAGQHDIGRVTLDMNESCRPLPG